MILGLPSIRCGMDVTYRGELRELNELNYARFEAKLEQRISELRLEIGRLEERMMAGFQEVESRFEAMDRLLTSRFESRFETMDSRFSARFESVDGRFETMEQRLMASLATHKASMVRWMLGFWLATVIPVLGLVAALMR